jgi:hypothetical protein
MITLRNAFVYLAHQEADRIHWYKTTNVGFGPKSGDWTSYVRSKNMASLYLTAIAIVKHFNLDQETFKKKVFKATAFEALRANKKLQSHCHKRAARKLVRRALRQIKRIDLQAMAKDVIPWLKEREIERMNRVLEEDKCASTR